MIFFPILILLDSQLIYSGQWTYEVTVDVYHFYYASTLFTIAVSVCFLPKTFIFAKNYQISSKFSEEIIPSESVLR